MYELKIGESLHGFRVVRKKELSELPAVLYEMKYEKNGAVLIFLDRDDENMTFTASFRTVPTDSTGAFHILEHSVLCGSKKFPVKEPFVELLKGSLQTFLNAMTYPDRTVYPVSSKNKKDFLNLTEVYLDAVFSPSLKEKRAIFLQEGTRRELDEFGTLSYNGVVYNEMRGAYSSPDELAFAVSDAMLFGEGSYYSYDSGGEPEAIKTLTYEGFIKAYDKFYHPSNAVFVLDGAVELDPVLSLFSSYIDGYSYREPLPAAMALSESFTKEGERVYEINEGESEEDKCRLTLNYLGPRTADVLTVSALDVALSAINGGADSPLQRAVMESELAEQFDVFYSADREYSTLTADFQNVKDGKCEELKALFYDTVRGICEKGIEKDALLAALNNYEFLNRERNSGNTPIGILYTLSMLSQYYAGAAPETAFATDALFSALRDMADKGAYENILRKYLLDNERTTALKLIPSASIGEERRRIERESLAREAAELSDDEIAEIARDAEILAEYQLHTDTEKELASLPSLSPADIDEGVSKLPRELLCILDSDVISHEINSRGISYLEFFFDASDTDDIHILKLLAFMLGNSGTDKLDGFSFGNLKKRELGEVSVYPVLLDRGGKIKLYLKVKISLLDEKKASCLDILPKLLFDTTLDDKLVLKNYIIQTKLSFEAAFASNGDSIGSRRALAYREPMYAALDMLSGYSGYLRFKESAERFDDAAEELISKMRALRTRLIVRSRLTLGAAGKGDAEFWKQIISSIPNGSRAPEEFSASALGSLGEGFAIPAQVGFAALAGTAGRVLTDEERGEISVASGIVNYEYLWSEVRVKGGAYGVRMRASKIGTVDFSSYRDPSPERSCEVFRGAADFLRSFASAKPELSKYIIGAIAKLEPYASDAQRASTAISEFMMGTDDDAEALKKRAMLKFDTDALLRAADIIDAALGASDEIITAPAEMLGKCSKLIYI